MPTQEKTYSRFTLPQRIEHWVLTISFALLAITGIPQRYALSGWAQLTIDLLGGIESTRIIHRIAATILALGALYHAIAVAYKVYVLRVRMTMLPRLKDATDMLDTIRYNLGLGKEHPKLSRYTFAEKIEYWALIWGAIIMGLTGFVLWNPIASAHILPGEIIPAALAAHSAEALLATLAIIIWHMYGVHIKTFNKSAFSGKLTRKQMLEEHAGELEEIEAGTISPPISREVKRKRERAFLPVAVVGALVMGLGLYAFVAFEETAITTVPPAKVAQVYAPATPRPTRTPRPTPMPTNAPSTPPTPIPTAVTPAGNREPVAGVSVIPHPVEGQEDCLQCHAADAFKPFPADHAERPLNTCTVCHIPEGQQGALPLSVKHDTEGRADCLLCHELDLLPESHQVAQFTSEDCLICHPTGDATTTTEPTASTVSFAQDILPLFKANCAACHGETALGGLALTGYQSFVAGGQGGLMFVAGAPDESLIVAKMSEEHPAVLVDADLQKLFDWIAAGAEDN